MSRPLRVEYKDAWYYVTNRGRRGERVFLGEEDYRLFLRVLREAVPLWNVNICAYCLMSNYYHLLIQTPAANLSRCMRHINGVYTQRFNRRYQLDGSLFRGRYKSILIGDEDYLVEVLRYICFDPVHAGVVKRPGKYPWSSYNDYLSRKRQNTWLRRDLISSLFKGKRKKSRTALVSEDAGEEIYTFFGKKNLPAMLGSREFIDQIRNRFFEKMDYREIPATKELASRPSQIVKVTYTYFGIKRKEMFQMKRGVTNTPRDVTIYLIRVRSRLKLEEISKIFRFSNYSAVSSAMRRIQQRIQKEPGLKADLKKIERELDKLS